jgi:hypothetical protein
MPTTTTVISRSQLNHPDLNYDGGAGLHSLINTIYETLGDNASSRYQEYTGIADSATVEIDHNFGSNIDQLAVFIYSSTGSGKTLINDYVAAGYSINEKAGEEKTVLEIDAPAAGGPHTFTVLVIDGLLKPYNAYQLLAAAPSSPVTGVLKQWYDSNGAGLTIDQSGTIQSSQYLNLETRTASFTATAGTSIKANTSGGGFTITLPSTIVDYAVIEVMDHSKTFNSDNVTLARNGNSIDGEAADFVLNIQGQAVKLIGDAANNNWIVINSVAGDSAEGGTNYYTNGSFESDVTTGVTIIQGAAVTAETTNPLQGAQSCLITQDNSATVADVRFAIDVTDSWVEEGGIVPLVEALVKADAADADGDVTFGVYNETDADWLYGPVDITGGGELNIIRASAASALVDGKTYVGRILRTDSTDTREVLVDRLRLDPINGNAVIPEATADTIGLSKKIQIVRKSNNVTYSTAATGILAISNIPAGTYEITVGADCFRPLIDAENASCYLYPQLNGSPIQREGVTGSDWVVGWARVSGGPSGATIANTGIFGYTSKLTMVLPLATNTFSLNVAIDNATEVNKPFYELKRLGSVDLLTTEWD